MKRTSLKRGSKQMKRGTIKKKSPAKISVLKRKLWVVFSQYIKKRDKNICFTCGAKVEGSNSHAGHFISKAIGGVVLYWHPDNVHCQCMRCNIWLGGNQYEYSLKLGSEKVKKLYALKNSPPQKWDAARYEYEINWYKQLLSELQD